MVAEWGRPVSAVLADIEPQAMAAASIGQVHRATTREWRDHPHVLVPRVDTALSTRRVLVSELHEGMRFDDLKTADEARRDRVAEIVHRFYYATAADHGLVVDDPHPGNWQSLDDGRVVLFDFGMVRELPAGRDGYVRATFVSSPTTLV